MVGTFLEPSCGRRCTPIHSIPYSVAQPLERGSNNYYSIIQGTTVSGQKYCDYSYAGSVSMVSVVNVYGETTYCFAYTITQTTTVKTLAPAEA